MGTATDRGDTEESQGESGAVVSIQVADETFTEMLNWGLVQIVAGIDRKKAVFARITEVVERAKDAGEYISYVAISTDLAKMVFPPGYKSDILRIDESLPPDSIVCR